MVLAGFSVKSSWVLVRVPAICTGCELKRSFMDDQAATPATPTPRLLDPRLVDKAINVAARRAGLVKVISAGIFRRGRVWHRPRARANRRGAARSCCAMPIQAHVPSVAVKERPRKLFLEHFSALGGRQVLLLPGQRLLTPHFLSGVSVGRSGQSTALAVSSTSCPGPRRKNR
jgi:hypothetical protein